MFIIDYQSTSELLKWVNRPIWSIVVFIYINLPQAVWKGDQATILLYYIIND